jgi:hypothetical protein
MAGYESAADTEEFLYCLSAFMSAFRTIAYRLYGVTENKLGIAVKHALKERLPDHPEIRFLIERTNVELHEDGVIVFQRFSVHPVENPSRWMRDRFAARYVSRWGWREGRGMVITRQEGWRFAENPKNLYTCPNCGGHFCVVWPDPLPAHLHLCSKIKIVCPCGELTELYALLLDQILQAPDPSIPTVQVESTSRRNRSPEPYARARWQRQIFIRRAERFKAMLFVCAVQTTACGRLSIYAIRPSYQHRKKLGGFQGTDRRDISLHAALPKNSDRNDHSSPSKIFGMRVSQVPEINCSKTVAGSGLDWKAPSAGETMMRER